ncbi:MAG: bifunctional metallophosphatase/5'-nucleotidase [Brevinemataceae bacterium]
MRVIFLLLLMMLAGCASKDIVDLKLVYINDMHAYHEPVKVPWISKTHTVGGFATVAGFVDMERQKDSELLFVDSGDLFTGPYFSALTKGEAIIDIVNTFDLDASTFGNHEFVYGSDILKKRIKEASFDFLNINIFNKGTDELFHNNPYKIVERKGIKFGIIGLHGVFAFYDTIQASMIEKVEPRDENILLQQWIDKIKSDVDIIVVLAHQGVPGRQTSLSLSDVKYLLEKDVQMAQTVKGIDILVQGHTHVSTKDPIKVENTIIVSAGSYTYFTGVLDFKYDKSLKKIISYKNRMVPMFNHKYPPKKETQDKIDEWTEKLRPVVEQKIAVINGELTRDYNQSSSMGNLFADIYMQTVEGADFAVINPGGLRQDHKKQSISYGDLNSIFPFPNTIIAMNLTGKLIKGMFEHSATLANGVLQVSKELSVVIDMNRPVGDRVLSIKLNGQEIEEDKTYVVNVNSFIAPGGDGFLPADTPFEMSDNGTLDAALVYFEKNPVYTPDNTMRVEVRNLVVQKD